MALSVRNAAPFRSYLAEIGRVRPLYFCIHSKPAAHSPPRPPLADASRPPPLPVGAYITMLNAPSPLNPHNYFCYTINTQPRPHPPPASVRPSSPLALRRSGRSVRPLAAPRAAPGGFDYIFYTTQKPLLRVRAAYPPLISLFDSALATVCRSRRGLRLLQTHARSECRGLSHTIKRCPGSKR